MVVAVGIVVFITVICLAGFVFSLHQLDYTRLTRARAFNALGTGSILRPPR